MSISPQEQVPLASRTTLDVGGPARFYFEADGSESVTRALAWASDRGVRVEVLGGGSNVLIADRGLDALVLRVRDASRTSRREGDTSLVEVGAGMRWDTLVAWSVEHGHAGLECLSGIPGDVGAAPMQNVGAYGQDVSETIERVDVIERRTGRAHALSREQCAFRYRDSIFKREAEGRYVVERVTFRLRPGGTPAVRYPELQRTLASSELTLPRVREAVLSLRRSKSMVIDVHDPNRRSVGSFFLNPVVTKEEADGIQELAKSQDMPRFRADEGRAKLSAAWLIERSGMPKGTARGRVGLSTRHSLAVVNLGGATAAELIAFAAEVRASVRERFGIALVPEPRLLGFDPAEVAPLVE